MPILVMTLVASLEKDIFVVFVVLKKDQEIKTCEKKKKKKIIVPFSPGSGK